MKLTADMFTFSRYEYEIREGRVGDVAFDPYKRDWAMMRSGSVSPRLVRTEKPLPMLLPEGERVLLEAAETGSMWPQWKRELLGVVNEALPDEKLEDIRAHVAYSLSGPGQAAQMEAHAFNRTSAAYCLELLREVERLRAKLSAFGGALPE